LSKRTIVGCFRGLASYVTLLFRCRSVDEEKKTMSVCSLSHVCLVCSRLALDRTVWRYYVCKQTNERAFPQNRFVRVFSRMAHCLSSAVVLGVNYIDDSRV
jgi:hypothetical protein